MVEQIPEKVWNLFALLKDERIVSPLGSGQALPDHVTPVQLANFIAFLFHPRHRIAFAAVDDMQGYERVISQIKVSQQQCGSYTPEQIRLIAERMHSIKNVDEKIQSAVSLALDDFAQSRPIYPVTANQTFPDMLSYLERTWQERGSTVDETVRSVFDLLNAPYLVGGNDAVMPRQLAAIIGNAMAKLSTQGEMERDPGAYLRLAIVNQSKILKECGLDPLTEAQKSNINAHSDLIVTALRKLNQNDKIDIGDAFLCVAYGESMKQVTPGDEHYLPSAMQIRLREITQARGKF